MALSRGELLRKLVHIGCVGFAFLLRFMTGAQAAAMAGLAFLFNWQVLPRIGGRGLWRDADHTKGYPLGILLYPLAVLGLVLFFWTSLWMAAAVWGVLAVGDGMASVVGQAVGGPRLPWNRGKGWAGFLAFVVFGTVAAAVLIAWTARLPVDPTAWHAPRTIALAFCLSLACALVESMPTTLDDNLTVPLVGALVLPLFAQAEPLMLLADPGLGRRVALGLGLNTAFAALAFLARSIDVPGALSAIAIGTAITAALGLPGLALMVTFFVIGSAATRLGYARKAARGIAQERGGARGWRHAWANGGVPAFLALMAGLSAAPLRDVLVLAYAAAVATAAADTCSSEVGKAYGRRTFLITTLRPVPPGTEGAVSVEGTLGGLLGAAIVAAVGAFLGLYGTTAAVLVAVAGLLGSLAESLVGTVAEKRGWLDNNLLNALNTAIGAALVVLLVGAAARVGLPAEPLS
jgi:uncharacterized protein (TIGR00297 family)